MPVTDITTDVENLTMTVVADASASVDRLWKAFTDPAQLSRFWGRYGIVVVGAAVLVLAGQLGVS